MDTAGSSGVLDHSVMKHPSEMKNSVLAMQQRHQIAIGVFALDEHVVPAEAFDCEAEALVQPLCARVVCPHGELDAAQPFLPCCLHRGFHQRAADAAASVRIDYTHAEHAAMPHGRMRLGQD